MNLALNILKHANAVQGLQAQIDGVYEAVETKTAEASEALMRYQNLKRETELALQEAGENYEEAFQLFGRADALAERLVELAAEHKRLTKILNTGAVPRLDAMTEERIADDKRPQEWLKAMAKSKAERVRTERATIQVIITQLLSALLSNL